jgi:exonuclease SbcC
MRFDAVKFSNIGPFREPVEVDFTSIPGRLVAVTGANGAGKSTFLEILSGSIHPLRKCPTRGTLAGLATARDSYVTTRFVNGKAWNITHTLDVVSGDGDSLVTNDAGEPAFASAKRKAFKDWALMHLPNEELQLASTFCAQGSQGFLDLKETDRKSVLLKAIGVERLEDLAKRASKHADASKTEVARINGALSSVGTCDVHSAQVELAAASEAVEAARVELDQAIALHQRQAKFAEQRAKREGVRTKLEDLRQRRANNAKVLADEQKIRAAAKQVEGLAREIEDLEKRLEQARTAHSESTLAVERTSSAKREASQRVAQIKQRLAEAFPMAARRFEVETAKKKLEACRSDVDLWTANVRIGRTNLEAARNAHVEATLSTQRAATAKRDAVQSVESIDRRLSEAHATAARRGEVDEAQKRAEELRAAIDYWSNKANDARSSLEDLRAEMAAKATGRIDGLRNTLAGIIQSTRADSKDRARAGLAADNATAALLADGPDRISQLQDVVAHAEVNIADASKPLVNEQRIIAALEPRVVEAEALVADLEPQRSTAVEAVTAATAAYDRACQTEALRRHEAANLHEQVAKAETALNEARSRLAAEERSMAIEGQVATAEAVVAELTPKRDEAERALSRAVETAFEAADTEFQARKKVETLRHDLDAHRAERERCAAIAKALGPLESAAARIAELDPQIAQLSAELEVLEAVPSADAPDRRAACESALEVARARRERAVMGLEQVRANVEKSESLKAELTAAEIEHSDWVRLSQDLGKNGLQAVEIDCAGPELTEMVNDLLHTCVGPRFTVSIEASRTSADGKSELDGMTVRVIDTVGGREAEAKTFSGGEKVIISEAVSLALTMLACRRAGASRPTIVRDESGAALDPVASRAWLSMLRRAADIVDASQILFVTHNTELWPLADARLHIENGKVTVQ